MLEVQAEIEELADQQAELDDLELVDSTGKQWLKTLILPSHFLERQNNPGDVERDLNGDIELDYNEEPDSSYRQQYQHDDSIKSPPPEGIDFYRFIFHNRIERHSVYLPQPLTTVDSFT